MATKIDISGKRFGRLTVISFSHIKATCSFWNCQCDCGKTCIVGKRNLNAGHTQSCGCYKKERHAEGTRNDLTGLKFGYLTVVKFHDSVKTGTRWLCRCVCGVEKVMMNRNLKYSRPSSCGCRGASLSNSAQINSIYSDYKNRANKKELEFDMSLSKFEELIQKGCHYCGTEKSNSKTTSRNTFKYNGLDRIDSSKGYTLDNVVPCCSICNIAKSSLSQSDFIEHIKRIYNYLVQK